MFDRIFSTLINTMITVLTAVSSALAIALSIVILLIAYKKYRQAIFLENPQENKEFVAFYQDRQFDYDSQEEAAKEFLNIKKLAAEYEILYEADIKREKIREKKKERKEAYYYLKSLNVSNVKLDEQQYDYVGFDPHWVADRYNADEDDDLSYEYYYQDHSQ